MGLALFSSLLCLANLDGGVRVSSPPVPAVTEERLQELERNNARLAEELDRLQQALKLAEQVASKVRISGYLDLGAFWVQGNGSGIQTDFGHVNFPQYSAVPDSWVFMGDPLSTQINARGDPGDVSDSRAIVFDPIHSQGRPSFIANAVNLALFAGVTDDLTVNVMMDFLPRTRIISDPQGHFLGDYLDLKLAYLEYLLPIDRFRLSIYGGKFDSVLGYEYRVQETPDRLTVTPSLICRYTCGRPIGVKARARFFDDESLIANLALTNSPSFTEGFGFYNETATTYFKTVSGRLSYRLPIGSGLEVGISGSIGPQGAQASDSLIQWHYGVDVHVEVHDFDITAEFVRGLAPGRTINPALACDDTTCLSYRGGYLLVGYRATNVVTPYLRLDARDALHENGANFVYITHEARATGGARLELGAHVVVKAEYTFNLELGNIPQFPHDTLTSSVAVKF